MGDIFGVVANLLDCDIVVSEFELPLRYYTDFLIHFFRIVLNPFIHVAKGQTVTPLSFYKDGFGIK